MTNVHPIRRAKPRLVEPVQQESLSYKDWLRANRKSREWIVQHTEKRPGDIILTGTGIEVQP